MKQQIVEKLQANIADTKAECVQIEDTLNTMKNLSSDILSLDDFDNDDYNQLLSILNFQDETIRDLGKIQNQLFFVLVGDIFTRCRYNKPKDNVVKIVKDSETE